MSLHDRIMALPLVAPYAGRDYEAVEMRNHASELAREADELMAEMAEELKWYRADSDADCVLKKYESWKEKTHERN